MVVRWLSLKGLEDKDVIKYYITSLQVFGASFWQHEAAHCHEGVLEYADLPI